MQQKRMKIPDLLPLLLALSLLAVPCALLNQWFLGWLVTFDPDAAEFEDQIPGLIRFAWTMTLLVTLEAPLATMLVTTYLGKAVFQESPLLREIFALRPDARYVYVADDAFFPYGGHP